MRLFDEFLTVLVRIPESLDFNELAEKYGGALNQSLESSKYGEIIGEVAMTPPRGPNCNHQIDDCGFEVELFDAGAGLDLLRSELRRLRAPVGTYVEFTLEETLYRETIITDNA